MQKKDEFYTSKKRNQRSNHSPNYKYRRTGINDKLITILVVVSPQSTFQCIHVCVCAYADRIPAKIGRFESITCLDRAIPCQQLPCYFVRTKPILVFIYSALQHTRANSVHVYTQGREGIYILKVTNATKKNIHSFLCPVLCTCALL